MNKKQIVIICLGVLIWLFTIYSFIEYFEDECEVHEGKICGTFGLMNILIYSITVVEAALLGIITAKFKIKTPKYEEIVQEPEENLHINPEDMLTK